jgi:hypothetical protein
MSFQSGVVSAARMPETIFDAPVSVGSSRIKGPHVLLRQLRRLVIRSAKTLQGRRLSDDERQWAARVHDQIRSLVAEGDANLPVRPDLQFARKVRKRSG